MHRAQGLRCLCDTQSYSSQKIEYLVLKTVPRSTAFPLLFLEHFCDYDAFYECDHITKLIRCICSYYVKLRMLTYGKVYLKKYIFGGKIQSRQQSNKLVLFRGL